MCHLAVWIQYGKDAAPHGKEFKSFGKKVMRARPDISVTVRFASFDATHVVRELIEPLCF